MIQRMTIQFIKINCGINECAAPFPRRLGRVKAVAAEIIKQGGRRPSPP
jgi:hypothetical protein